MHYFRSLFGVEVASGLISEQKGGPMDDRSGSANQLLLAAR
jgi:hypothetical protein